MYVPICRLHSLFKAIDFSLDQSDTRQKWDLAVLNRNSGALGWKWFVINIENPVIIPAAAGLTEIMLDCY